MPTKYLFVAVVALFPASAGCKRESCYAIHGPPGVRLVCDGETGGGGAADAVDAIEAQGGGGAGGR